MELFLISMAVVGVATTITAIDEFIDWLPSYRRVAREMAEEDSFRYPPNNPIEYRE